MRKNSLLGAAVASLALLAGTAGRAQPYSNAVMALNPVAYWPLNEATQPPQVLNLTATNLGALGPAASGFYGAWYQPSGNTWFLTNNISQVNAVTFPFDGSKAMNCQGGPGQYVVVPRNTNGVQNSALALNPPFSIEAWLRIGTTIGALGTIVSQGGFVNQNTGGPNPADPYYGGLGTGWAGVELGQYQDYLFLICNATNGQSKANELDTSGYNQAKGFHVGDWVHVVATFDGTTEAIWTNGVLSVSKSIGLNGAGLRYVADPTTPLMIGCGSDVSASYGINFNGAIHDVAIYSNVLSPASITNHFQTAYGTNATFGSAYTNAVLADFPALYYRLNDAQTNINAGYPSASFPVATNYGSAGATAGGVYQPGTTPGVAGPPFGGFGAGSKSVALNGWLGAVDVGGGSLPAALNPTGYSPLTVVAWFRGGPADAPGRFQEIVGHSDASYRLALGQTAGENHFNPGPGPELQFVSPDDVATNHFALNDGQWHMAAGVSDGTNEYLYLDGVLAKSATTTGINIAGSTRDLLLGGDPQYTFASPNAPNTIRNFDGQLAQVAFWTNALSGAQIQQIYGAAGVPPFIVSEPPPAVSANSGQVVTVPVVARGSALAYQWYRTNGAVVAGQTTAALSFNPIGLGNAGSYYLAVTNRYGAVTSSVVQLTVVGPPVVLEQSPTDVRVFVGTSPALRVSATGPSLSYQWQLGGATINGATLSSYNPSTAAVSSGTYTCVITNSFGAITNSPITVAVLADPSAPFPQAVLADHPRNYFRLDEAGGTVSYDYAGGLNGTYTNTALGAFGYTSGFAVQSDPTETAPSFGGAADSYDGNVPAYLDFASPTNTSVAFSIEAWLNSYGAQPSTDAGLVTIGYGFGGEEFAFDCGGHVGPNRTVRFYINDASGGNHGVAATNGNVLADSNWHHVVAVCDEVGGLVSIYVDGVLNNSVNITPGKGIHSLTAPLAIGSRLSSPTATTYDNQFSGSIDDVAIYNTALSAGQVMNHYLAAGIAPVITLQPTNTTVNEGGTARLYAAALGTAPLAFQWYDISSGSVALAAQTNAILTISNVPISDDGHIFQLTVTNIYGQVSSFTPQLSVIGTAPNIDVDLQPLSVTNYQGTPFTYSVGVSGSEPLHYQWKLNGGNISSATNSSYSFNTLAGTNLYLVAVTNSLGFKISSTATNVGIPFPTLNPQDYTYKLKIGLPGYNRGETLRDFPVLVQLGTNLAGFAYSQFASPNGGDLRFADASGTRVLPHEIDEWNPAGASPVWVQLPRLVGTNDSLYTNNFIWAYWGNPAVTAPASQTNGAVWVPQPFEGLPPYQVVYHLKEGALPFEDSTQQHPATNGVAPTAAPGVVGTGGSFNGGAWLDAGTNDVGNNLTLAAWVNIPTVTSIQTLWANQHGGYGAPGFALFVNTYGNSDGKIDLATGGTVGNESATGPGAVTFGAWHQLEVAIDRLNGTAEFYVDGTDIFSSSSIDKGFNTLNDLNLGRFLDGNFGIHGTMDEARIRQATSSANWVWAEYMTVAANNSFQSYSAVTNSLVTLAYQVIPGNKLVLTWPNGTLLQAPSVLGPWTTNSAPSPYTNVMSGQEYFRVKVR
jgi:hypothetical protein